MLVDSRYYMGYTVRMPQMGLEMEQGTVVTWNFEEGDSIEEGDVIAVVESEKASNDVAAREDGEVRRIAVPEGTTAEPGDPIGIVAGPDEDIAAYEAEFEDGDARTDESGAGESRTFAPDESGARESRTFAPDESSAGEPRTFALDESDDGETTDPDGEATASSTRPAHSDSDRSRADFRATPGAKQLANERNVDLGVVDGTGPQGTITADDVTEHEERDDVPTTETTLTVREVRELSGVQRTVGERMTESYRTAPHVTLNRSFETGTLRAVEEAAASVDVDVSLTDLLVRVVGAHLVATPAFNARYEDGEYRLIEEANVGVAVAVDEGLLTPVVPAVNEKSVEEVAEVRTARTQRALSGAYSMDDLSGGTFSVSNLGMFGVDSFDPIINPPEVAVLGVGRIRGDGTMTLSLSFDHRVANGADAAKFLDSFVDSLMDRSTLVGYFDADVGEA